MINFILIIVDFFICYELVMSLFTFKKYERISETYRTRENDLFTILIACRNEEEVIWDNLKAIYDNSYAKYLYDVYVFADNCTDNTVQVCRDFATQHPDFNLDVIEVDGKSKPKALNLGIQYLKDNGLWTAHNIVILDADNKISVDLLSAYNFYHMFYPILQCKIESDNDDSIVAKSFTAGFNSTTYRRQIARNNIQLSGSLSGTGFSVAREVFDTVDFQHCSTLTEDLEFSVMSIIQGFGVKFIQEQYVLNQNLDKLKPSIIQRTRWCRGHMQVAIKLSGDVIRAFIRKPSLQLFDTLLFINSPIIMSVSSLVFACIFIFHIKFSLILLYLNVFMMIYACIYNLYVNRFKLQYLLTGVHFSFFMTFSVIYGTLTFKNKVWNKTVHTKKLKEERNNEYKN